MTVDLLPPTDRDLPRGRHEFRRDDLLRRVHAPAAHARWVAPAAAAVVVAGIAGAVAGFAATSGHGKTGAAAAASDATLQQHCGFPGGQLAARFDDHYGTLAAFVGGDKYRLCVADLDGSVQPDGGVQTMPAWTGPTAPAVLVQQWADAAVPDPQVSDTCQRSGSVTVGTPTGVAVHSGSVMRAGAVLHAPVAGTGQSRAQGAISDCSAGVASHEILGQVSGDVTRVVVTWAGRAPVEAAVGAGVFAARVEDAAGDPPFGIGSMITVQAYAADGTLLGTVHQQD
jgi:hypothetical protein